MAGKVLFATFCVALDVAFGNSAAPKPNIIFIMADDQGWNNQGFHNPALITPHTNKLVSEGVRLGRHYVYKFCSPTRCSMLSGRLPIHVNQENSATEQKDAGIPVGMTAFPARLREVGYSTHQIGKWHAGMASPAHIPTGAPRGFDTALSFFNFGEDHYTQRRGGEASVEMVEHDIGATSQCPQAVDLYASHGPAYGLNGTYSGFTFTAQAVARIEAHDALKPLFMYIAFANVHPPLQVPSEYTNRYPNGARSTINGMVTFLDESVGNITAALQRRGLWDNTLLVYSPDNGGYQGQGGDDTPLRGGKFSDFEGGVRVAAFLAGGFLPKAVRGTTNNGMIHVADWYATFCALAGVKDVADVRAADAGLPPLDSLDVSELVLGRNTTSPRTEIVLSAFNTEVEMEQDLRAPRYFGKGEGVVAGPDSDGKIWKLIVGTQLSGPFGDEKTVDCADANISNPCFDYDMACPMCDCRGCSSYHHPEVRDAEQCQAVCQAEEACSYWTLNPETGCWLKDSTFASCKTAGSGYISGPKVCPKKPAKGWGPSNTGVDCTCRAGCLYELIGDENELNNVAADYPEVLQEMQMRLQRARPTVYAPYRGDLDMAACVANDNNKGFWSPWLDLDTSLVV